MYMEEKKNHQQQPSSKNRCKVSIRCPLSSSALSSSEATTVTSLLCVRPKILHAFINIYKQLLILVYFT